MRIAIVTNSSSYEPRVYMAADFFVRQGHQVFMILSDFIHREKIKGRPAKENAVFIDTIPYKRNISWKRLYSHYDFSKKVYDYIQNEDFDLLYVLIPANSLAKYAALYKRHYKKLLIIDILDLWPESLPIDFLKNVWPISIWSAIRNNNLKYADLVITECNLYQKKLECYLKHSQVINVYWPRETEKKVVLNARDNDGRIHICYLGSINHIIDIDFIIKLLSCIQNHKMIDLHIIGDGESREELLKRLDMAGIKTTFYGSVYGESEKMKILSSCDYGLNIMKNSVCVGVTMKSVDYLYAGLKLLNNIKGDTWRLIENNGVGYNCSYENMSIITQKIVQETITEEDKLTAHQCYLHNFSRGSYIDSMERCLKMIEKIQERLE
ncbi:hypothetical protein [Lacrimispora sp.]|uniref:hypothetical protein n=1 Tax=Lacrimispora sp. TaxID=2719234 RepID=UPI002FDA4EDC